jgi:hypothetical protein
VQTRVQSLVQTRVQTFVQIRVQTLVQTLVQPHHGRGRADVPRVAYALALRLELVDGQLPHQAAQPRAAVRAPRGHHQGVAA